MDRREELAALHALAHDRLSVFLDAQEATVVLDAAWGADGVREVTLGEADWLLSDASRWCATYRMTSVFTREAYEAWAGSTASTGGVFTAEVLDAYAALVGYRDCPLAGCMASRPQTEVPVHDPRAFYGIDLGEQESFWLVDWSAGGPRPTLFVGRGTELGRVAAQAVDDLLMFGHAEVEIDMAGRTRIRDPLQTVTYTPLLVPPRDPDPKSKVPRFLRERRPRLDGRRR
jgi:hypothetical protein